MKELNILYLVNQNTYRTKMSRVRFHGMKAIGKKAFVIWSGLGWRNYNSDLTVQQNLEIIEKQMKVRFDLVVAYKHNELKGFADVKILKCIRFNEMYNFMEVIGDIESSNADLVVCHHDNDIPPFREFYNTYHGQTNNSVKFVHVPHCAEATIFKQYPEVNKEFDLLLCGRNGSKNSLKQFHYPLRDRLFNVILKRMQRLGYKVGAYKHPGYNRDDSFKDVPLIEFSKGINSAKICLTCSGVPKSRFGKYIEIPMSGSAIAADIPDQNQDEFRQFVIEINMEMTDDQIVEKLKWYLDHDEEREKLIQKGLKWSDGWTQEKYAELFINEVNKFLERSEKVSDVIDKVSKVSEVVSEKADFVAEKVISKVVTEKVEVKEEEKITKIFVVGAGENWIIDYLKEEWCNFNGLNVANNFSLVNRAEEADIIWLIAPYRAKTINPVLLKAKKVVTTIHHINDKKIKSYNKLIDNLSKFTNRYHVITQACKEKLIKYFGNHIKEEQIVYTPFWVDNKKWHWIEESDGLRKQLGLPTDKFLIGSFQRDTEGNSIKSGEFLPKLEKGPDRFIAAIDMMQNINPNIEVVLTGYRRDYVTREFDKRGVKYHYFERFDANKMNDLYNALDLYMITSRVEGAPRAVVECAAARVPVISTNVGIVADILDPLSIYDGDKLDSVLNAIPNPDIAEEKVKKLFAENYIDEFNNVLFNGL